MSEFLDRFFPSQSGNKNILADGYDPNVGDPLSEGGNLTVKNCMNLVSSEIAEANKLAKNAFIEIRQNAGEMCKVAGVPDKKYVKIYFDDTNVLRNISEAGELSREARILFECEGMPVWGNQLQSAFPHLVQLISRTRDGNKKPMCLKGDPTFEKSEEVHGKIAVYKYSDEWKRKWPNTVIVGSAQCGKTGPLVVTCINNIIYNLVFQQEIMSNKMKPMLGLFLSPARTEIHSNFKRDYHSFVQLFNDMDIVVEYYDKDFKHVETVRKSLGKQVDFSNNLIRERIGRVTKGVSQGLTETDKKHAKYWLDYIFGVGFSAHAGAGILNNVSFNGITDSIGKSTKDYKIMAKLCRLADVVTDFHIDETHHSTTKGSVIVQITKAAHVDEDESDTFITGITWTPYMFKDVDTFYWTYFRYPRNKRLHGFPMFAGTVFHHDMSLVDLPEIQSWEWAASEYDLPLLNDLDLYALSDANDFREKKYRHRNPVGDYRDDRCVANEAHDIGHRAGVVTWAPRRNAYLTTPKDFSKYADHQDYKSRVWAEFARMPFAFWKKEMRLGDAGRHLWTDSITGKKQRSMAIIKLNNQDDCAIYQDHLLDEAQSFEKSTGIRTRIITYAGKAKAISKSANFMQWYKSYGPSQGDKPFADDEHIIILITGSMRMGVRIPGRSQFCFDSSHYNYKADTDSPLQGLCARHWGYGKGKPLSIVSPSNSIFFLSYEKMNGDILQNCKGVSRIDNKHGMDMKISFEEAVQVAVEGKFYNVVKSLLGLKKEVEDFTTSSSRFRCPDTGHTLRPSGRNSNKYNLPRNVTQNVHMFNLLSDDAYLEALGAKMELKKGYGILRLGESCMRTRKGVDQSCTYLTHNMTGAVRTQARWEWMAHGDSMTTFVQGNQGRGVPAEQRLAVQLLGRWVSKSGQYKGLSYEGDGKPEITDLVFPIKPPPAGSTQEVASVVKMVPLANSLAGGIQSSQQAKDFEEKHGIKGKVITPLVLPS
jgi:hypothetical protein